MNYLDYVVVAVGVLFLVLLGYFFHLKEEEEKVK